MATIQLPVFEILFDQINSLPGSTGIRKLLLKPHFPDLNNPARMRLLVYFTKNHKNYAEGKDPHLDLDPLPAVDVNSNLAIGNNDLTIIRLMKKRGGQNRVWAKIQLVPVARPGFVGDTIQHLAFEVKFFNASGGPAQIDVDPVISNPSPPAKPSDEELQP